MNRKNAGPVTKCQSCSSSKLVPILRFGHHPIVQEYLTKMALAAPEITYPLNLVFCSRCTLAQLNYIVEPKKVFPPEYPYRTGLTQMLVRNFEKLAATLHKTYFAKGDLVVDIGSNDGSLLKPFKKKHARVLGVEPTNAAKAAERRGIPTMQDFFGARVARAIRRKYGAARVITATNVFAHINNPSELVQNIATLMDRQSVFVSESQYLRDIVEKLEFDTVYHEHLRFYSLKSIARVLSLGGLSVVDAERISAAGGSIRVYAKKGMLPMSGRARSILSAEKKAGLHDAKRLLKFAADVKRAKRDLIALLLSLAKKGTKIAGLGSPARSNTLLNFAHIDETILSCVYEKKGSPKIGLYTPGSHILVVDEKSLAKNRPAYLLILSWHIGKDLMRRMRERGYRGTFIMPLPRPKLFSYGR